MKRYYTSTCILNHTVTTRSAVLNRIWWTEHEHPEVESVTYDEHGFVKTVEFR